jgi:hypothetical protein
MLHIAGGILLAVFILANLHWILPAAGSLFVWLVGLILFAGLCLFMAYLINPDTIAGTALLVGVVLLLCLWAYKLISEFRERQAACMAKLEPEEQAREKAWRKRGLILLIVCLGGLILAGIYDRQPAQGDKVDAIVDGILKGRGR